MTEKPTPALLDKKRKTSKREETMILYREHTIDNNGVHSEKIHGPMPISKWPAYEKENGL